MVYGLIAMNILLYIMVNLCSKLKVPCGLMIISEHKRKHASLREKYNQIIIEYWSQK